uniref:Uncharacterized protein n=1 Tax=Arabidopsis thaliana TaxID=3702 RepID=Q0WLS0_ARATH|nr:hypothetical protein [Arabidopsis thaliana]
MSELLALLIIPWLWLLPTSVNEPSGCTSLDPQLISHLLEWSINFSGVPLSLRIDSTTTGKTTVMSVWLKLLDFEIPLISVDSPLLSSSTNKASPLTVTGFNNTLSSSDCLTECLDCSSIEEDSTKLKSSIWDIESWIAPANVVSSGEIPVWLTLSALEHLLVSTHSPVSFD